MNQAEEFFSDLKEWSTRKLSIIKKYIGGFSNILGSRYKEIYYVDGFAGRGLYDNGEKGSPVLAAEASEEFRKSKRPFTLICINVEKDHENFTNLCDETNRFGNLVENYEGSFEDNVDRILTRIKGRPAVFFIDPFGIKGIGWSTIERIIAREESTDIWIRFDYKTVRRLFGFFDSYAKDAQGKLHTLQNQFGITDISYLQTRLGEGITPEERINNAVLLYIEQLEKAFGTFGKMGFAGAYPIISLDGQRKYHLIFACAHPKAATLANNIVNGIEETFLQEKEEYKEHITRQMSFLASEATEKQIFIDKVNKLKDAILLLSKNKPYIREELHYELMASDKKWFGKIGRRHFTKAIKELLNESPPKISCSGAPGRDDSVVIILE